MILIFYFDIIQYCKDADNGYGKHLIPEFLIDLSVVLFGSTTDIINSKHFKRFR